MAMPPLDKKGKNAIAIVVMLLIGAVAYWNYLWSPAQVIITGVAAHADTLDTLNANVKREVAKGNQAKLRADAIRYTNELVGLRRLVPTENEVPAMLESISNAARQVGLEVSEFSPDGTLPGDDFDMVKYRFGVIGPYHKVAEFLTSIASSPRIISPINVQVNAGAATESRRPRPGETFVNVKFGVITYVAKTKATPAPAPAKPGAK
jgi:type IV pilus assembly protein PilO